MLKRRAIINWRWRAKVEHGLGALIQNFRLWIAAESTACKLSSLIESSVARCSVARSRAKHCAGDGGPYIRSRVPEND